MADNPQQKVEALWWSKEVVEVTRKSCQAQHMGLAPQQMPVQGESHRRLQGKYRVPQTPILEFNGIIRVETGHLVVVSMGGIHGFYQGIRLGSLLEIT